MLQLSQVRPQPLIEQGISSNSDIFATEQTFEQGKKYLVLAPSGKGKSTFLHILYGLRRDFDGKASIDGRDIRNISLENWATIRQKQLSIMFQDLRLFLNMTVSENIQLKLDLWQNLSNPKLPPPSVEVWTKWAKRLGIENLLAQACEKLSYGQRQRVALLRALCQPFEFLLLDEPFSNLDQENIRLASELIEEVCEQQCAGLVLVSLGDEYFFRYDEKFIL
jgi:ABC-type lipoprotein export system ATPase subunit